MFSLTPRNQQLDLPGNIQFVNDLSGKDPVKLLELLSKHIDLPTLIPKSFYDKYYASNTNNRDYSLECILSISLLMHFFKFPTASTFFILLALSPDVRAFCRVPEGLIPDASVISKFKIAFEDELRLFFENLVLPVIEIFTEYDDSLPDNSPHKGKSETVIYDTTGLKPKVKENNPKTLQSQIKKQSSVKKLLESKGGGKDFNIYAAAYKNMPKEAQANDSIKLGYANGHFGYFYKFGMVSNGFGIPLHIRFLDKDFYKDLPSDFDTVEDQKYTYDNASLYPVLSSFRKCINKTRFTTFIGDSEFDSYDNYGFLNELGFQKVLIPINDRNTPLSSTSIPINTEGIPCCPKDNLPFISDGKCNGQNRSLRLKYVCPKSRRVNNKWQSDCNDKCRDSNSTVTSYTYPSGNLRVYSGVVRGSDEWDNTYKLRTVIEREIASMKSHPALDAPKTYNCASLRADVYLNAATKLITVMLAFALDKPNYMRNLNKILKFAA